MTRENTDAVTAARLPTGRVLDIECLRALAIIFTVVTHLRFIYNQQPRYMVSFFNRVELWGGVDLFFVISGFVIFKNLLPQWRSLSADAAGRLRFVFAFWLRRVRRLLPAAWFWAFASLGLVAVLRPGAVRMGVYDVMAALLQVYNFHAYLCSLGHAVCGHVTVGVYWSLSLEEQFYIVLPILLALLKRNVELFVVGMLLTTIGLEFGASQLSNYVRLDGFCWGMLIALLYDRPALHVLIDETFLQPLGRLKYLGSALVVITLPVVCHGFILPTMTYPLVAASCAGLVLLASYDKNYLGVPGWVRGPLLYLGARSYSIYLVHPPVFLFYNWLSGGDGTVQTSSRQVMWPILAVSTVIAFGELSYRFIEQRWRYGKESAETGRSPKRATSATSAG